MIILRNLLTCRGLETACVGSDIGRSEVCLRLGIKLTNKFVQKTKHVKIEAIKRDHFRKGFIL